MKSQYKKTRFVSLLLAVSLTVSPLISCSKKSGDASTDTEASSISSEKKETETSAQKSDERQDEKTEASAKRDPDFDRQISERIEEYKSKLDSYIAQQQKSLETTRLDVHADFLQTLQYYYLSTDNYTTQESNIGDLITSTVADTISDEIAGGSSTVSAAIVAAANGIQSGDRPDEIVADTFVTAMEELPNEVTTRVYDYLLGETIFKALDVFDALTTNRQTQHLANLVNVDIREDIRELSHICSKEDLTIEDCFKGMALTNSILQQTYEIEQVLKVNAGSRAWRPFYQKDDNGEHYGNYITADLNEIAQKLLIIEEDQRCKEVLDSLENIEKTTGDEVTALFNSLFNGFPQGFKQIDYAMGLDDYIKSMYDWDDSMERSQDTKLWNVANTLIGNPITDIFLEKYNQQEGIFIDALAEFNSQAQSLWLEQYIPLKCKLRHFNAYTAINGGGVVWTDGGGDDIDHAIALAYLKAQYSEDGSYEVYMEKYGDLMSQFYNDLYAVYESTRIMYDAYYLALTDSETNLGFLNKYRRSLLILGDVIDICPQPKTESGEYPGEITYGNETCVKIGEAAKKLMDFYIEHRDARSDIVEKANIYVPSDEGIPVTCTVYLKTPANEITTDYMFAGSLHREGYKDIRCYGHHPLKNGSKAKDSDMFWIEDGNSGVSGHVNRSHSAVKFSDANQIPDNLAVLIRLRPVYSVCEEVWNNPNPSFSGVPLLFETNVDSAQQTAQDQITRQQAAEQKKENRHSLMMSIQARAEAGEDMIWTKPEELEQSFIEKYVKTVKYEELMNINNNSWLKVDGISEEPKGFGTLTCTQPLTAKTYDMYGVPYTQYESLYQTGGGKELKITITQCWYLDENDKAFVLDFFLPKVYYNQGYGELHYPSLIESVSLDIFDILDP